jgi:hypothetical protein
MIERAQISALKLMLYACIEVSSRKRCSSHATDIGRSQIDYKRSQIVSPASQVETQAYNFDRLEVAVLKAGQLWPSLKGARTGCLLCAQAD